MPRKDFSGTTLAADVARLLAADKVSPPEARLSLMDVVRALCGFIETRSKLRWTDAMIAAVLTKAGYPIGAATLRSYRKRMRDEGLLPPLACVEVSSPAHKTVVHSQGLSHKDPSTAGTVETASPKIAMHPEQREEPAPAPAPRPPPDRAPPRRRSLSINPSKLPSNEA